MNAVEMPWMHEMFFGQECLWQSAIESEHSFS